MGAEMEIGGDIGRRRRTGSGREGHKATGMAMVACPKCVQCKQCPLSCPLPAQTRNKQTRNNTLGSSRHNNNKNMVEEGEEGYIRR